MPNEQFTCEPHYIKSIVPEKPESRFEVKRRNKQFILHCNHEIETSDEVNRFQYI